ncbi:MAG: glycosyl hydrolase 53 family protein [Bdellovibrionales bacterium]|nr:glycosyl hydrolase 53 family protein [Bdellovibrionales bacterium]
MFRIKISFLMLLLIALVGCQKKSTDTTAAPTSPTFSPIISMSTNISSSDSITLYTTEYQTVYSAGLRGAQTVAPWSSLNTTGTTYDLTMITNSYFGLSAIQGYGFSSILLTVPIIAITSRKLPADISANNFNDSAVKTRYRLLIDQLVPYLNSSVKYVSLGNEVDSYFATHSSEWTAYKDLIEDARSYLISLKPNIKVGVTTTFEGATSTYAAQIASLNANMDVIIMTYYPISGSFVARDPSTVSTDMQTMITMAAGKPIVMQEWGYPSSVTNGGSTSKQADFITNTFSSWRVHGTDKIPFISFFKRREWTSAYCGALTGQTSGQAFYEFMCSLGLLNNDSTAKTAYTTFLSSISGL